MQQGLGAASCYMVVLSLSPLHSFGCHLLGRCLACLYASLFARRSIPAFGGRHQNMRRRCTNERRIRRGEARHDVGAHTAPRLNTRAHAEQRMGQGAAARHRLRARAQNPIHRHAIRHLLTYPQCARGTLAMAGRGRGCVCCCLCALRPAVKRAQEVHAARSCAAVATLTRLKLARGSEGGSLGAAPV